MIGEIEAKIGYHFKNRELVYTALTHRSFNEGAKEKKNHNERLEFLGDSVIGLAITDYLYRRLKDREEGELAKLKAHLVSANFLHQIALKLDLGGFLFLGRGEEKNNGRQNRNILASAFEALIGAVYLDANFRAALQMVVRFFEEFIEPLLQSEARVNDYKSELQEVIQRHRTQLPVYRVLEESGKPPRVQFIVAVFLESVEIGRGKGGNRREAEQRAALQALQNIGDFIHFEKLSEVFFVKDDSGSEPKVKTDKEADKLTP